jgi:hypothetical protein
MTDIKPKILKDKANLPEVEISEINLTNSEFRVDEITGRSAKICSDAWKYSVDDTDMELACTLFDYEPLKKFMIFTEDGKHRLTVKTYKTAAACLNKGEVIVYFSGK